MYQRQNRRNQLFHVCVALLLFGALFVTSSINSVALAHNGHHAQDECVIPDSGPWPPCATGGNSGGNTHSDGECVIPESGPWPPCATNGGNSTPAPAPSNNGECVIPDSGPWPPCATDGSNSAPAPAPAPSNDGECVIPDNGPWPPCATGGNGSTSIPTAPKTYPAGHVEARIDFAIEELQTYWQSTLKPLGITYRPPSRVTTFTGPEDAPPNAFYVPAMDAIFIDLRLVNQIVADHGDYAAVAVLAHEWGHFVQDQLGALTGELRGIELQADCFAGSFTLHMNNIGRLQADDLEEARGLFYAIGDDQINPDAPYNHPGAHGTGDERLAAFEAGWQHGANHCINN